MATMPSGRLVRLCSLWAASCSGGAALLSIKKRRGPPSVLHSFRNANKEEGGAERRVKMVSANTLGQFGGFSFEH